MVKNRIKYLLTLALLACVHLPAFTQSILNADSLEHLISIAKNDTQKVNFLNLLSLSLYQGKGDYVNAEIKANDAKQLAEELNYKKGVAKSLNNLGNVYLDRGFYEKAIKAYSEALTIFRSMKLRSDEATELINISTVFVNRTEHEQALDHTFQALRIYEDLIRSGDKTSEAGIGGCYLNLGIIYEARGDIPKATENYNRSIIHFEKCNDRYALPRAYTSIGALYYSANKFADAVLYFQKSLDIHKKYGNKKGTGDDFNNIGLVYQEMNEITLAVKFLGESRKISEELGDQLGVAQSTFNIAEIYGKGGDYEKAEEYYLKSIELCKKVGSKSNIKVFYQAIANFYADKKDFEKAFRFHGLYSGIKDTIFSEESSRQTAEMQTKYDTEKKEQENYVLKATGEKQRAINLAISVGLVLVVALAFFIYRGSRQKQKANRILGTQNQEINKQKNIIEEKNKDITDSIRYAKRLQQAILKPSHEITHVFPESFILFKPKDIVSGDFYWFEKFGDHSMVAAADCTGHGVPGAFMSILGCNLLSQAVNEYALTRPAVILNSLNKGLSKILHQRGEEATVRDGMDIALCVFNFQKMTVEFAAAYNPLWLVRDGAIMEFTADKFPVGAFVGEQQQFRNNEIPLHKGDIIYVFSDGYADQFGGPKGKKFKYKPFQQLILSMQSKPMHEQRDILNTTIEDWKGGIEQLDDILIIGVRV